MVENVTHNINCSKEKMVKVNKEIELLNLEIKYTSKPQFHLFDKANELIEKVRNLYDLEIEKGVENPKPAVIVNCARFQKFFFFLISSHFFF